MSEKTEKIAVWERGRREHLQSMQEALSAEHIDMDHDPLAFLAILDHFVAAQDYESMDAARTTVTTSRPIDARRSHAALRSLR